MSEHAPTIRRRLRQCLEGIGYHPDFWSERVLFSLLVHPQGMAWISHPFILGPHWGRSDLERGLEFAVGVPDTTYRSASKFHRAYRRAFGAAREPERPGPKPGQPRNTSAARLKFEAYVLRRVKAGVSAYLIAQDAEAQRLYGIARDDHAVVLDEQTVRRVLRKHRSPPSSP